MIKRMANGRRLGRLIISICVVTLGVTIGIPIEALSQRERIPSDPLDTLHRPGNRTTQIGILNADRVNIRQGPDLNAKIIGRIIREGVAVKVIGKEGDWIKIFFTDTQGWIYGEYLDIKEVNLVPQEKAKAPAPTAKPTLEPTFEPLPDPLAGYQKTLQRAIDLLFIFLNSVEERQDIWREEKEQIAIEFIRYVRWGPENKNYFRIIDLEGDMILDPLFPGKEGQNYMSARDPNGKSTFVEFIRMGRENGQGFVKDPGRTDNPHQSKPMEALVKLFEPWGWIVITELELDRVEAYEEPEDLQFNILLPPISDEAPASST
ncbi:MAG: cache domain-containing protein [Deltaproteobacteria bacterium]|nr:cache domain-containing protein [Deltaproteobacteria bacterium]MBW2539906.1 cache domain-containing protein [Deltaproteobacteria bacterium]